MSPDARRALARFLRVPAEPPTPPPGRASFTRAFRPSPRFLHYLLFVAAVRSLVAVGFLGLILLGSVASGDAPPAMLVILGLILGGAVLFALLDLLTVRLRYEATWYVMTDRALRNRRGIWTLRENTVSFDNVQNLKVSRGPVQRLLGIQDLVIETAAAGPSAGDAGAQALQCIVEGIEDAPALRDRIAERMRRSRGRGLGDAESEPLPGRGRLITLDGRHLELLREIRDALRGTASTAPGERSASEN